MNRFRTIIIVCFIFNHFFLFAQIEKHFKRVENKEEFKKTSIYFKRNIDFIYLINLDERPEKLKKSLDQLHPFGIYPCRFSAINGWKLPIETINEVGVVFNDRMTHEKFGTHFFKEEGGLGTEHEVMQPGKTYFIHLMRPSIIGIALSHLSILKDAYDSGYQTIWVMEDDIEVMQDPKLIPKFIDELGDLVGNHWDILFTDCDFRNSMKQYVSCKSYAPRPNYQPKHPQKFAVRKIISQNLSRIGARYGFHSMIIRRSGIKKILDFYKTYHIFSAIDVDFILAKDLRLYCLNDDVVSQLTDALSDNSSPNYSMKLSISSLYNF